MPDPEKLLSQPEVDALLSAIDAGEVEVGVEEGSARQVVPYDFRRPQRVSHDQIRALENLHEIVARNLQADLSGILRTLLELKIVSVDQLTYSEFINSLPNPTVFTVVACEPLQGNFILELNPVVAFAMYERLVGSGRSAGLRPERPLTEIEWRILGGIFDRMLERLREVWTNIVDVRFRVSARESNPHLMTIMAANEAVVSVVIEVLLGEHKGYINLCIPVMAIEPFMQKLTTQVLFAMHRRETASSQENLISKSLASAEITLAAHLPEQGITVQQLKDLRVGDTLVTGQPAHADILVNIEGLPKFRAGLGTVEHGRELYYAAKIQEKIDSQSMAVAGFSPTSLTIVKRPEGGSDPKAPHPEPRSNLQGVLEIPLMTTVVLSERVVHLEEILGLKVGVVMEFGKGVDELLELRAGDDVVARGTAVKIGEKFGLQVAEIREPHKTVRSLGGIQP